MRGKKAPMNPWGGATQEWFTPSPPPPHNFIGRPVWKDRYSFESMEYDEKTGEWVETDGPGGGH